MAPKKLNNGKGAICSVNGRYIHHDAEVDRSFINIDKDKRFEGLIALRQELRTINGKEQLCIILQSDDFMDGDVHVEIYAAVRWIRVDQEGPKDLFFNNNHHEIPVNTTRIQEQTSIVEKITQYLERGVLDREDVVEIDGEVEIDDDNDQVLEDTSNYDNNSEVTYSNWGHDGICNRQSKGTVDPYPTLESIPNPKLLDLFETLFPVEVIKAVIIPETNNHLRKAMSYGEFLRWIGLWLLMATTNHSPCSDFWSKEEIDPFKGAPYRFHIWMSGHRFNEIKACLRLSNDNAPAYNKDRFWSVRYLLNAWNANMNKVFHPGWISCVDKSMSVWTNKYTCPGFIYAPHEPQPFGNEYYTICCGVSGLMFAVELREGKDTPEELLTQSTDEHGKTVGIVLRLCRKLSGSGRCVVLNSGYCTIKAIVELRKKGIFAAAVLKKCNYWPQYIDGEEIISHFENKEIGDADARNGVLDGVPFTIFCLKEPKHVLMIVSTYGTLDRIGKSTSRIVDVDGAQQSIKFKYPVVIASHYKYRHTVDDHNAKRHGPISLEATWTTTTWYHRVFAFLLAITEVNILLWSKYADGANDTREYNVLSFRKKLANSLINNKYIQFEKETQQVRASSRVQTSIEHSFSTLPPGYKFDKLGQMIKSVTLYHQVKCITKGCQARVRTYCICSPPVIRCAECYAHHIAAVKVETQSSDDTD